MTGKERIYAVLQGRKPDFIPVFPKISFATAQCAGYTVGQYMSDPSAMSQSVLAACEKFGWDGVGITTDISLDGMALGSQYQLNEDAPYTLKKRLLNSLEEADQIVIRNPWDCPGYGTVLRATQETVQKAGDRIFVQAWCNGPLNVSSQLYDLQELLMDTIDDPEGVHHLLEICTQAAISQARELIRTGADAVAFGHATASPNVISRNAYCEFALPYEKRIIDAIHEEGGIAITHICGKIETIVDKIAENGSDIIDFDSANDIQVLLEKTGGKKVFRGNIAPVLFTEGTPEEIKKAVKDLLDRDGGSGKLLLGSGCEVNLNTPAENLQAFMEAARG